MVLGFSHRENAHGNDHMALTLGEAAQLVLLPPDLAKLPLGMICYD